MSKGNKKEIITDSYVLSELYETVLNLTSNHDLESILCDIGESAKKLLKANIAICYLYDSQSNTYALAADIGKKIGNKINRIPREDGPTAAIVSSKEPLISNDAQNELTPYKSSPFTKSENVKSVIGLPLKGENNEIVGVLYVNYRKKNMITDNVLRNAHLLANIAAISLSNARLFKKLFENEASLNESVNVGHMLSEALAEQSQFSRKPVVKLVLDEIAKSICDLLHADCATIYPYDLNNNIYYDIENVGFFGLNEKLELTDKPRTSYGMSAYVQKEKTLKINDIFSEKADMINDSAFIRREKIKSFLGKSIETEKGCLAVLYVSFRSIHYFTQYELHITKLFANQASVALQMAHIIEKEQTFRKNVEVKNMLDEFGTNLAHKLTNTIGPVRADALHVKRRLKVINVVDQSIINSMDKIINDVEALISMAETIKKMKNLIGEPELVNINKLISNISKKQVLPKNKLIEDYTPDLFTYLPIIQLNELIENIVVNAIEHMSEGGELSVKTYIIENKFIGIEISDTGPGIPNEFKSKIFELGSSKKKSGGMGYGLWWCKSFIDYYGGEIGFYNKPEGGCTFTLSIPLIKKNNQSINS